MRDSDTKRIRRRARPLKPQIRRWMEQTPKPPHESKRWPLNEVEIRLKQTSYLLHGSAVQAESLLELDDKQKGSEQPGASATAALRRLPEAGSSTAERWPQRKRLTRQPHCALSSPGSSMCRTPPFTAAEDESITIKFNHSSLIFFSLNKPVHNNWELEGDEIIIFL